MLHRQLSGTCNVPRSGIRDVRRGKNFPSSAVREADACPFGLSSRDFSRASRVRSSSTGGARTFGLAQEIGAVSQTAFRGDRFASDRHDVPGKLRTVAGSLPSAIVPRSAVPLRHDVTAETADGEAIIARAVGTDCHFIEGPTMRTLECVAAQHRLIQSSRLCQSAAQLRDRRQGSVSA